MVSVCSPLPQYGQSFSVFTFSSRDFVVFAKLLFLVSAFITAFSRGSSSTSMSMTKINISGLSLIGARKHEFEVWSVQRVSNR